MRAVPDRRFPAGLRSARLAGVAWCTASRIGPRHTGPCPGTSTSVSSMANAARLRTQPSWSWLNSLGNSWGPVRGATGCPVTSASPLTSTPSTTNEQCPPVCPGLGMAIGAPGRPAATSAVSACAVGMPSRVNAPLRLIATDHFSQRGCQMCSATSAGEACSRYSRLACPTSSAWQYTGMPWVLANQIAEPK